MTENLPVSPRSSYVERVIKIPDVELLDLSTDGRTGLVLSNRSGSWQLDSIPLLGGELHAVSHGRETVSWARIAHDSERVVFSRDFGGKEEHQLFLVSLRDEKEEQQFTRLPPTRILDFNWSHRDDRVAFAGATKEVNGVWLVKPDGDFWNIYRQKHWVFSPEWSKDDSRICVSAKTTEAPTATELVFIDPDGEQEPDIYTPLEGSENTVGAWHPEQPWILFKTDARGRYDLAVYETEARRITYLKGGEMDLGLDFPVFGWMRDGKSAYYLAAREGRTRLYMEEIESTEPPEEIPLPEAYHASNSGSLRLSRSGEYVALSWSSLSKPGTISRYELATRTIKTVHEHFTDMPLGRAEHVVYTSFDGRPIHGWFLKPPHLAGRRPCVLWIHGGPEAEVADQWNPAIQAFIVAGYTLFAPNIRGSTGYGVQFQNLIIRDVGGGDLRDVEEAAKYLSGRPDVDSSKVVIVGASYGGYMTFLGMTKLPEYWAAGVAIVGITDWKELYESSDALFRSFIERYFGSPEENPDLYRERSPVHFVDNLKSPLLIWHRGNDSRCPLPPIEKFAQRLKQLGKKFEMNVVWDEGHAFQKTENMIRQYQAVVEFIDRQVGPLSQG